MLRVTNCQKQRLQALAVKFDTLNVRRRDGNVALAQFAVAHESPASDVSIGREGVASLLGDGSIAEELREVGGRNLRTRRDRIKKDSGQWGTAAIARTGC